MPSFDADSLAAWTGGRWSGRPACAPAGFSVDSRRLAAGQAFVALKTDRRDGHDFLGAALKAGASAAVVARADPRVALPQLIVGDPLAALQAVAREHRRSFRGPVVAVTGSAGKTSTKELLWLLLGGEDAGVLATEANLNNQIGVALTLCRLDPAHHRYAVVEAGISAPGEMRALAWMIEPDIALVTLVGPAHLAGLGGLDAVAREKAVLAGSVRKGGICVFPSSCEAYPAFRSMPASRCLVVEPGEGLDKREAQRGRVRFTVAHAGESTTVAVAFGPPPPVVARLCRVTDGMAQNTAMAVCAALETGVPRNEIERRLLSWRPSPLRGEWRVSEGRRLYLDCYNANPASMADALAAFVAVAPRDEPRLFVIGCMEELGADSQRYHLELGKALALRSGDRLVAVGSQAGAIRMGALEGKCDPGQIEVADSVEPLSARLAAFRGSVFVKGSRRHELEKAFVGTEFAEASHA
ncbi:MAG TPA: UDP-N-acetylmuramoyl-tripeptide--D-alanyl-D-alanine ligase [Opitutaceae bacterium]|nr:UDP-N-acetylmuramoyl-tripeptide--D-alanyl-D-alanine ligase [Opitutaceae bacterium]